jgi:hypothetical protein
VDDDDDNNNNNNNNNNRFNERNIFIVKRKVDNAITNVKL